MVNFIKFLSILILSVNLYAAKIEVYGCSNSEAKRIINKVVNSPVFVESSKGKRFYTDLLYGNLFKNNFVKINSILVQKRKKAGEEITTFQIDSDFRYKNKLYNSLITVDFIEQNPNYKNYMKDYVKSAVYMFKPISGKGDSLIWFVNYDRKSSCVYDKNGRLSVKNIDCHNLFIDMIGQ